MALSDRLHAVVFDEAHVVIVEAAFRPKLQKLAALRRRTAKTPFVALTATLPPADISALCTSLALSDQALCVRLSSLRPNIKVCAEHLFLGLSNVV